MEILKLVICDFVLFSLIEAFIFCLFFNIVGGVKISRNSFILISIFNCVMGVFFQPILYQIICIIFMGWLIHRYNIDNEYMGLKNSIKLSILATLFTLIVEGIVFMIFEMLGTNISLMPTIIVFIYMIPIRIIQISLVLKGGETMKKFWFGSIKKPVKK